MFVFIIILIIFGGLFGIYILMMRPQKSEQAQYFSRFFYAHRGLHGADVAENSLTAFQKATDAGYAIELDVQLSADGDVVVFHDPSLARVCGVSGNVLEKTWAELSKIPLSGTADTIPRFSDVLAAIGGKVPLLVELKPLPAAKLRELCEKTYALLKTYPGRYCIESFHPVIVYWFYKNAPEVFRGQLACKMTHSLGYSRPVSFVTQNMLGNFLSHPQFIAFNEQDRGLLSYRIVRRLWHADTAAWTVRDEQTLKTPDFDFFIFEGIRPETGSASARKQ